MAHCYLEGLIAADLFAVRMDGWMEIASQLLRSGKQVRYVLLSFRSLTTVVLIAKAISQSNHAWTPQRCLKDALLIRPFTHSKHPFGAVDGFPEIMPLIPPLLPPSAPNQRHPTPHPILVSQRNDP